MFIQTLSAAPLLSHFSDALKTAPIQPHHILSPPYTSRALNADKEEAPAATRQKEKRGEVDCR